MKLCGNNMSTEPVLSHLKLNPALQEQIKSYVRPNRYTIVLEGCEYLESLLTLSTLYEKEITRLSKYTAVDRTEEDLDILKKNIEEHLKLVSLKKKHYKIKLAIDSEKVKCPSIKYNKLRLTVPLGYECRQTKDDRTYYICHETKSTSWMHPCYSAKTIAEATNIVELFKHQKNDVCSVHPCYSDKTITEAIKILELFKNQNDDCPSLEHLSFIMKQIMIFFAPFLPD